MSSVILTNWTVFYSDDAPAGSSGYKQIKWTGAGAPESNTNTVNELYSALADLFSIAAQNNANDTIPTLAVTPTVYNIGTIDQRDQEAWFIDPDSVKHLTSGSLQTVGWTRVVDADANLGTPGILKVPYTGGTPFVASDIGRAIANGTATGTLLWYDASASEAWIRPTNCTSTHNWAGPAGTIAVTGGTGSVTQNGAAVSGERLWSNIYSIGTIEDNTNLIVYQNFTQVTSFWSAGHINRLFLVNDGFATVPGLIDYGYLTVFARQYSKLYDHYLADASAGGSNPIPLSTNDDFNNTTGYRIFTAQSGTGNGTFTVGNYLYFGASWAAATKKAVITAVAGTSGASSTPILTYYPVGDYSDFANGNAVVEYDPNTGADGDATCTASAPTNTADGPLDTIPASITIVFGGTLQDLSNGNGNRPYSVSLNCQGATLAQVYERLKYLTRNGQVTDIDTGANQSHIGQQYTGTGDLYVPYDTGSIDNPFSEVGGENITATSFTSVLTSKHDQGTNEGFIVVRNTRGTTPVDNATLTGGTSTNTALVDTNTGADPVTIITAIKTAPFGTFAGGQFFGARGVWIYNMHADDANDYSLIDAEGVTQDPPATYPVSVTVLDPDNVAVEGAQVFIRKSTHNYSYNSFSGNAAGDADFVVTGAVDTDLPQTGWLHLWVASDNTKQDYRYASWSTATNTTFVFPSEVTGTADAGGSATTLIDAAGNFTTVDIQEGDTIRNTTDGAWAIVDEIVSATQLTTSALSGGNTWGAGDTYSLHRLAVTYIATNDLVDIPIFNSQTNGSGAASTSYAGSVPISIDVRIRSNQGSPKYVPFNTSGSITSAGFSLTAILTVDTVAT